MLPSSLQDIINSLPKVEQRNPKFRAIFEAFISQNTVDEDAYAPPILIVNQIDDEPCPPWEFHWTNKLIYGWGIPAANHNALEGCDCDGPCDPESTTCSCVIRNQTFPGTDPENKGFGYNRDGTVKYHGAPIWECNAACGCSRSCMNRVLQRGRTANINLTKTRGKGWGVFAVKPIPGGTFIGIYAGELLRDAEADARGRVYDRYGRTYLFNIDFHYLNTLREANKANHMSPSASDDEDTDTPDVLYAIDAFHAGNHTRFLNHSCDPNCALSPVYVNEPDPEKPFLAIFTQRNVVAGEELTFSYYGEIDDDQSASDRETDSDDAVRVKCLCGAKKCIGRMWR
ncbi:hypothetical protein BOTBODRAFT_107329 [Botryobasidium botryosum FD-172 SS1]|uniref:SET domain-containing protein n=1 Tax=Botryobasidium botryosum (strain FD-172 SS1) TaxID=930990 RepID=A0A067MWG4_BOTB1|nr:hypothetical protein BOTBODRAFT_107329 [Botryobasidium botryosum FD-172 SS1]